MKLSEKELNHTVQIMRKDKDNARLLLLMLRAATKAEHHHHPVKIRPRQEEEEGGAQLTHHHRHLLPLDETRLLLQDISYKQVLP